MLVLTRRPGEKIIINDTICIELLKVSNSQASIGISAPENISVFREEIYDQTRENTDENQSPIH